MSLIFIKPLGLKSLFKPRMVLPWRLSMISSIRFNSIVESKRFSSYSSSNIINFRRSIHSTNFKPTHHRGPKFNRGIPSTFGFFSYFVPDALRAIFLIMGVSAFFIFFMGPLLIITIPPLVIGGFLLTRWSSYKRNTDMKNRLKYLSRTSLVYRGSDLDEFKLGNFALDRIIQAIRLNEDNISSKLSLIKSNESILRTHHSLDSRLELTGFESIDQTSSSSINIATPQQLTVVSFGLLDADKDFKRIGTVVITLRPRAITSLLDIESNISYDSVIEVHPLTLLPSPIIFTTPSDYKEPPTLNIKPNRF